MRKKGFTLIELLTVIAILAIIILIAFVSISSILKQTKSELSDSQKKAIEAAAQSWSADNMDLLPSNSNCSFIILKDLKNEGLLDSKIIDPKNEKNISNNLIIKIASTIKAGGKSVLSYEVDSNDVDMCDYIGLSAYVKVDLPSGLTPVVYDGDNWKVIDKNSDEWYDYDEQKWANAVTLLPGVTKKVGDEVAVDGTEASMMLVWIPRYEYKYTNLGDQYAGGTAEQPGEISINFISKNTITPSSEEYKIHPAFTFGNKELSGIWVGKFELSHTTKSKKYLPSEDDSSKLDCINTSCSEAQNLRVLPDVSSLRYNDVSNFWYGIKSIENTSSFDLSNIDIHMIKNSEWGAVAYLSQSKYGKYGNPDYEGTNKEVYINNSISFCTGRSGGNPSGSTPINETYTSQTSTTQYNIYGFYTYDGYLLEYNTNNKTSTRDMTKGSGASTTGNIYGVYDMSGSAFEYVMGAYGTEENGIYSGYSVSENSGFNGRTGNDNDEITNGLGTPAAVYYDLYKTSVATTACNDEICYGHALSETEQWYNNSIVMVLEKNPWSLRGGGYGNATSGVFKLNVGNGNGANNVSTRIVGVANR